MQTHEIPRNYRGEGRILYIFSTKGLIYTVAGASIGLVFYLIFKILGFSMVGLIITAIFAAIGFVIGTVKIPESTAFEFTKKTGGESIDDVIKRWVMFKKKNNRIYVYKDEEIKEEATKDGK